MIDAGAFLFGVFVHPAPVRHPVVVEWVMTQRTEWEAGYRRALSGSCSVSRAEIADHGFMGGFVDGWIDARHG